MRIHFSTLENVQITELIEVFNLAFAQYLVQIRLDTNSLADKILAENIILKKSVGAFFENKLVGFILLGIENSVAYNGGTGVLPEFRGNSLTGKMYDFILPKLKEEGICNHQLEVITKNLPALKTYEQIGFQKTRTLACFRGQIVTANLNPNVEIKNLNQIDRKLFPQFWNSPPSWQNSLSAVGRTEKSHQILGAFYKKDLVGYLIYSTTGRVSQFAVDKNFRRLGIGQSLFAVAESKLKGKEIIITNIDKNDRETISFLGKLGLDLFLEQFEMTLKVDSQPLLSGREVAI